MSFPSCTSSEFNFPLVVGLSPLAPCSDSYSTVSLSPAGVGGRNLTDKEQGFNETVCRVCFFFLRFVCAVLYRTESAADS